MFFRRCFVYSCGTRFLEELGSIFEEPVAMRQERYDKVMVIWSDIWILASASNKCLSAFRRLNGREIERQCGFLPLFKETVPFQAG